MAQIEEQSRVPFDPSTSSGQAKLRAHSTTPAERRLGTTRSGLLIAFGSAASFALAGPMGTVLLSIGWSPAAAVGVRVGGAFVLLLVPCLLLLRRTGLPNRRQVGHLLAYGAVAVAGAQLCYFSALQYLSVGMALLVEYMAPVILIGYHWARSRRRPATLVFVGAAAAIAGLVFVLDPGHGAVVSPLGLVWAFAGALCACGYFLLSERGQSSTQAAPGVPPLLLVTGGTGVGGLLLFGFGLIGVLPLRASTGQVVLGSAEVPWWLPMLVLVVVTALLAYLLGIAGIRRLGSGVASFVGLTEVIFAVLFAAVLLGQRPNAGQLLGGLLVLIGIAAVQRGDRR